MTLLFTAIVSIKDWKALRELHSGVLLDRARCIGATRYQVYRDLQDASLALIVAELPDDDALQELREALWQQAAPLDSSAPDSQAWELIGWEGIG